MKKIKIQIRVNNRIGIINMIITARIGTMLIRINCVICEILKIFLN